MRDHWPKLVIVALLLAVVGVPFLLRPAAEEAEGNSTAEQASGGKLIIITPHNEQIRAELARGFNAWRATQNLPPVEFDWRASGGTTDLRKGILAQYQAKAERGRADDGIGADLFFGGGEYDHNKVAQGVKVGGETVMIAVPAPLPKGCSRWCIRGPTSAASGCTTRTGCGWARPCRASASSTTATSCSCSASTRRRRGAT